MYFAKIFSPDQLSVFSYLS